MSIFGIMLVKNEADIISACLEELSTWIDKVFILDNGSTDGTWEIVQSMRNDRIVPWKTDTRPFKRSMRAEIFNQYRSLAKDGDWWYIADSDEFLTEDPHPFLAAVPSRYHVVFKKSIDYFLTNEDVAAWEFTGDFKQDREHITRLEPKCWSEIRFFRHRKKLEWAMEDEKPAHIGRWYPQTILSRHYQFRSPAQMQSRLDVRNSIPRDKQGRPFRHVREKSWEELLRAPETLVADRGIEQYRSLPSVRTPIEKTGERIIKSILYGTGIWP